MTAQAPETRRRNGGAHARALERRVGLPSGRAVVGALLMTLAALGVFLAHGGATDDGREPAVVAGRDLAVGTTITAADLETVALGLAEAQAARSFPGPERLVGQTTLDPVGAGELIQASDVSDAPDAGPANELTFRLPASRAVDGDLEAGDLVDVFVTADGTTGSVVRGVPLLGSPGEASRGEVVLRVAVRGDDDVVALVHALNTGDLTVVRATHAGGGAREPLAFDPGAGSRSGGDRGGFEG